MKRRRGTVGCQRGEKSDAMRRRRTWEGGELEKRKTRRKRKLKRE